MQKFKTLADIIALAEFAHRNQTDKAGLAYIEHPRRVMQSVQAQGALPYVQMAAILHDVTEDTAFTLQMLLDLGVPEPAVDIVRLMDRSVSDTGDPATYYENIACNPGARMVKLADIADNLAPWRLAYLKPETVTRLHKKYAFGLDLLGAAPKYLGEMNNG